MSMLEPEDIAKWEEEKMKNNEWKIEEIETANFDENGKETGTWKGYAVKKIDDPANYSFECRNKTNAIMLCDFLNDHFSDDLHKWKRLLKQLKEDEKALIKIKENYKKQEMDIIQNTDFNKLYGANNKDVRKAHITKKLKDIIDDKKSLELKIENSKREISYLKASTYRKTEILSLMRMR